MCNADFPCLWTVSVIPYRYWYHPMANITATWVTTKWKLTMQTYYISEYTLLLRVLLQLLHKPIIIKMLTIAFNFPICLPWTQIISTLFSFKLYFCLNGRTLSVSLKSNRSFPFFFILLNLFQPGLRVTHIHQYIFQVNHYEQTCQWKLRKIQVVYETAATFSCFNAFHRRCQECVISQ